MNIAGSIHLNLFLELLGNQLKLVSRLMQTAGSRGVKRDIFYVTDGGYDTHSDVDLNLINNFGRINAALQAFVGELKVLNLWNSTTVVQFSEFARTLDPNTGGMYTICVPVRAVFLRVTLISSNIPFIHKQFSERWK